jgi:putative two-component system response regulator
MAKNIALYHHEKWDGSGYCHGLKGTSIPIEARIVSIIDIFDALISKRCYKEAFPLEKTLDIIKESRGIALDPDIVDLFLNNISQFQHDQ